MGRSPCCAKVGLNRGAWDAKEDEILTDYMRTHGEGKWRNLPQRAGLKRCGKSCRLRWLNYLKPGIKRGNISPEEEDLIFRLHKLLGNRWSLIAGRLPGRTDNEIKNYWNSNLAKRIEAHSFSEPSKRSAAKKYHAKNPTSEATGIPATMPIRTKARRLIKKLPDLMPPNDDYIIKSSQPQNTVEPGIIQPHEENDCNQGRDINVGHVDLDLHMLKFTSDDLQACDDGAKGDCVFTNNELCSCQENSLDLDGEITLDGLSKQMIDDDNMNLDLGSLDCFLDHEEWLYYSFKG